MTPKDSISRSNEPYMCAAGFILNKNMLSSAIVPSPDEFSVVLTVQWWALAYDDLSTQFFLKLW